VGGDLDDLAGALADGDAIDWRAAHARQNSPDSRSVVEGLESLSRLSTAVPGQARPSRRLPRILETARLISIAYCVAGIEGFIVTFNPRDTIVLGIFIAFAGTATFLDLGGRDRRARALAACFWATAGAFASRGVRALALAWPEAATPEVLLALRPDAFFALAVWQFARDFPNIRRFGSLDRVCTWGIRATTVIGVALFTAAVLPLVTSDSGWALAIAPRREGAAEVVFASLVFGAALAGLAVIGWRGRFAEGSERGRVRLFLYAVVVSFGPMMLLISVATLVSSLYVFVQSPRGFFWAAVFVYPPMFLLPVATAYAVAARDVLNVKLVIQRGLRYLLARWLLLWGAAIPLGLLLWHLYRHADLTLGKALATGSAPTLIWFAGVGALVLAFRGTLTRALDEWALPGVENPAATLAAMSERMKLARTPLEVGVTLATAIERALQAPAQAYLFVDGALVPAGPGEAPPPAESAIPALMEGAREPSVVSGTHRRSYYSLLLESDRAWIDARHVEMVVPVVRGRAGSGLLGLVTLSSRRNALGFSEDDVRFVRAAAASASLACDAIASEGLRADAASVDGLDEMALQCARCGGVQGWSKDSEQCPCGGAWQPAALPKRVLQRFDLTEWVGAGGMGVVYRALDLTLGRDVALKTLPQLSTAAAERLMTEARAMASLSHDDVAVLYEVAQWRGTPLLVMEYLAGGTLAARLRGARVPDGELIALVRLLALALGRVHAKGLYHGDVKPSNVGFAADGTSKLLDFGLARALSTDADTGAVHDGRPLGGTWAYLAPEVRDGAAPGPRLDLWALGVVLCEGLLGEHPFPHARSREEVVIGRALALSQLRRTRSDAHHRVVERVLALDPAERPAHAAAFADLLAALA
jgi:hypothetical protein